MADLIEVCFAKTLDEDGREYLRQMRWAARDVSYLSWMQSAAERIAAPLYGFVWEESGRIAGNLSLIPLYRQGKLVYLIANVAVHPDHRGRGIGRQLTQTAIAHLRERRIETAWLQVREDNPIAFHLYRSLGFQVQARRATWLSGPSLPPRHMLVENVAVTLRRSQDWKLQAAWLRAAYPPEVSWNLPLNIGRLSPSLLPQFFRWMRGEAQNHWVARLGEQPLGFVSWEPMRTASDALWLAADPAYEEQAIMALLPYAFATLSGNGRTLSVNYHADRAANAFERSGFSYYQTLLWMSLPLNEPEKISF